MLYANTYLLLFAVAFMGCVLVTPLVTRVAARLGAIDRPDQFRRIHKGATPRLGGLGLAFGLVVSIATAALGGQLQDWADYPRWIVTLLPIGLASLIVLAVGVVDDTREMGPRIKLLGQASAVLVLYLGGVRIDSVTLMHLTIPLDQPSFNLPLPGGSGVAIAPPSLLITMLWFLACMNIWNLIDGMDGLASGVGLLVSGTLALVAIWLENPNVAILAVALAGGLAGFLLYNWHPACIFLGDSGSLLIGLFIGIVGVQGSLKEGATISILFPILAMGLPITDTAMAIFRRWVRNLPLSSADRRHVHHLLIGLGLNPRQAAALLYCFSAGLCGVVLIGVVTKNELLAGVMGVSGCLAFLLILTSRRDELTTLRADLATRTARKKQERFAAKVTWEAIQRVELCESPERAWEIMRAAAAKLGCDLRSLDGRRDGRVVFRRGDAVNSASDPWGEAGPVSGPMATFRLSSGRDLLLVASLHQDADSDLAADIAFRFAQRLALASAERLERLLSGDDEPEPEAGATRTPARASAGVKAAREAPAGLVPAASASMAGLVELTPSRAGRPPMGWLRGAFGRASGLAAPARSLGDD